MGAPPLTTYAATFTYPASTFWRRISTPRQEHQVGRFLGIPEKRLARRAYQRTHGKATSNINELACADGHRKVGRDFARADRVPETTFHQRCRAGGRVLQELPDLRVVHKRRDALEKTSPSGSFLGRSFYDVPQEGGERVAKSARREECLRSESAFRLCVRPKDAQEQRPLVSEDGIQARPYHSHPGDEIVNRHSVVALRPEYLGRLFQREPLVEAARPSTRPSVILNHLVQNAWTMGIAPIYN